MPRLPVEGVHRWPRSWDDGAALEPLCAQDMLCLCWPLHLDGIIPCLSPQYSKGDRACPRDVSRWGPALSRCSLDIP